VFKSNCVADVLWSDKAPYRIVKIVVAVGMPKEIPVIGQGDLTGYPTMSTSTCRYDKEFYLEPPLALYWAVSIKPMSMLKDSVRSRGVGELRSSTDSFLGDVLSF
jgi:hypothetical protein